MVEIMPGIMPEIIERLKIEIKIPIIAGGLISDKKDIIAALSAGADAVSTTKTAEGLKAVKVLAKEGIKTNVTLIFSANQALLAAEAGASYVSPFLGRLDDINQDGVTLIADIVQIFENYGYETEIIAASVRHPMHVQHCALAGADIATVPYKVIMQMINHPLTAQGIEKFIADYKKVFGE